MIELAMSEAELLALPVAVDLVTAGRAFGLGRTKAFELARRGDFPCAVISVGKRYRVPRSALLAALGIDPAQARYPRRAAAGKVPTAGADAPTPAA